MDHQSHLPKDHIRPLHHVAFQGFARWMQKYIRGSVVAFVGSLDEFEILCAEDRKIGQPYLCLSVQECIKSMGEYSCDIVIIGPHFLERNKHPVSALMLLRKVLTSDGRLIVLRDNGWYKKLKGTVTITRQALHITAQAAGYLLVGDHYIGRWRKSNYKICAYMEHIISAMPFTQKLSRWEMSIWSSQRFFLPEVKPSVSIIMPCRNEAGTIERALSRMPALGKHTELICIEGHSQDNTLDLLHACAATMSHIKIEVMVQTGIGKGNAVHEACAKARGDILIIFDGDMTVAPEDMQVFYQALIEGRGSLMNGTRLLLPRERKSMRIQNWLANKGIAWCMSHALGRKLTDTLCGTKACWRRDYVRSKTEFAQLWNSDPFGDFSWLVGTVWQRGKIVDIPVHYTARVYGRPLRGCFRYAIALLKVMLQVITHQMP